MRRLLFFSLALAACGGESHGDDGGAHVEDGGPPQFEVRLETEPGDPIEDGDELGVHYGCQGGAHTNFSVIATGEGLEGAELVAELSAMRITLPMTATATGAELIGLTFVLSDFAPPGSLDGMSGTLTATVRRGDGASVVVERDVTFVEADRCTVMCTYDETVGRARITAVDGLTTSTGCTPETASVTFDFVPDSGTTEVGIIVGQTVPPECVDELGLVVGGEVAAIREDLLPGTGTCTPRSYRLALDYAPCAPICPAP